MVDVRGGRTILDVRPVVILHYYQEDGLDGSRHSVLRLKGSGCSVVDRARVRDSWIPTSSPNNQDSRHSQDEDTLKETARHLFLLYHMCK